MDKKEEVVFLWGGRNPVSGFRGAMPFFRGNGCLFDLFIIVHSNLLTVARVTEIYRMSSRRYEMLLAL